MAETLDDLKVRIRELEKEVERWKSQVKSVRYGLNWMDVPEAFDKDSEDKIPILEEVAEKAVDAEGPLTGKPPHVIIEGDNYHALTCLNYTHRGKIDVIYIDPPYNTGSDGFTYKDKRFLTEFPDGQKVPKEHPLRHSYWLSFMEKRLKLAKNLLSDKGVIFISIDDNEQANLKLLCDKVFGEGNLLTTFPRKGIGGRQDSKYYAIVHEYIQGYAKRLDKFESGRMIKGKNFPLFDESKKLHYKTQLLRKWGDNSKRENRPNLFYPIYYNNSTNEFSLSKSKNSLEIYPMLDSDNEGCWRWGKSTMEDAFHKGLVEIQKNRKGEWIPYERIYDNPNEESTKPYSSWIDDIDNSTGASLLKEILQNDDFSYPKPVDLIDRIIRMSSIRKNITILDFFAGSGTTLHATLNLNKEDDGIRQCILVQQSEGDNNICENVTYERNRRVMCGYTNAKGESVDGLGGSLKYYKTGFVGKHQSKNANDADKVELAEKAGCLIALAENTLEIIKVPKAAKGFWQIYSDNAEKKKRYTCIYHNGDYGKVSDFVAKIDELRATDKKSKFTVYVFSWNSPDFFENEFDDLKNIEIKAIPKPILEIYKALNG